MVTRIPLISCTRSFNEPTTVPACSSFCANELIDSAVVSTCCLPSPALATTSLTELAVSSACRAISPVALVTSLIARATLSICSRWCSISRTESAARPAVAVALSSSSVACSRICSTKLCICPTNSLKLCANEPTSSSALIGKRWVKSPPPAAISCSAADTRCKGLNKQPINQLSATMQTATSSKITTSCCVRLFNTGAIKASRLSISSSTKSVLGTSTANTCKVSPSASSNWVLLPFCSSCST